MNVSKEPAFYYHADANAFGGILKQPLDRIFSTMASVSLAQAGGFSASHSDRYSVDGLVSVQAAHVHVSGTEHHEHGGYRTIATAIVEGLSVFEVVTADRIVAQVSVMHPYRNGPAGISLLGSQFVNLRLNGVPVRPKLDRRLFGADRDQALDNSFAVSEAPQFRALLEIAEAQFDQAAVGRRRFIDTLGDRFAFASPKTDLDEKGSALCSLVQEVEVEAPAQSFGHVIHIPDFGNIFLGELCVSRFSAELTMLRIEMGCMGQGTVSAGSVRSNGRFMP